MLILVCLLLRDHFDLFLRNNWTYSLLAWLLESHCMYWRLCRTALINILKGFHLVITLCCLHLLIDTSCVQPWLHSWPLFRILIAGYGINYLLNRLNSLLGTYLFFRWFLFYKFARGIFKFFGYLMLLLNLLLSLLLSLCLLNVALTSFVTIKDFKNLFF